MSVPLTINGVTYQYPQQGDTNWGPTLTAWSTAVTNGMLQKAGGSFPLTAEVDFGASFGLRVLYVKSEESNIATTGFFRLANNSTGVGFRNSTNSADLLLTVDISNQLTFNGVPIGGLTSLLNGHIFVGNVSNQPADVAMSGDATIVNTGVLTISNLAINNAKVATSAAIALSKLATVSAYQWITGDVSGVLGGTSVTALRAVASDSNGLPIASATTATELGYVSGATSNIQAQINAITASGTVPAGGMMDFGGTVAPTGWLLCDGSAVSRSTYANLFSAISTTWGAGDGSTTFNVPNMTRRTGMGSGGSGTGTIGNAVGNTGGEEGHTLTQSELSVALGTASSSVTDPGHVHSLTGRNAGGAQNLIFANTGNSAAGSTNLSGSVGSATTGISVGTTITNALGGNAHNNIQPSAIVLKIIKT